MATKKEAAEVVANEVAKAENLVENLTEKAEKLAEEVTAKAEKLAEEVTAKAEKLAEEVTTTATDLVQKVSDRVQAESSTIVEKVKTLVAQLQSNLSAESLTELSHEATALLKEIQTTGYQALKSDYELLRTTLISNLETLQANSSLKTFANELLAKLPSKKAA